MRVRFGRLYEPLRSGEQKVTFKDGCAAPKTFSKAARAFLSLQGWNELPLDLVKRIIECSTPEQGWSTRQISRSWAEVARQTCCFQALVPSKCSNILSDTKTIAQQQLAQRLPHVSFTLVFTEPASFAELADVLRLLVSQATHLVSMELAATVLIPHSDLDQQLMSHMTSIVSTSATLMSHSITVTISFCAANSHLRIPTPAMLLQLAPVLQSVDLHSVPMQLTPEAFFRACPAFTSAQIAALRHSPLLTALCVFDTSTVLNLNASISELAQLSSLTKLHLTAPCDHQASDFQPLSQLTAIEDLALQSSYSLSCAEVLSASRQTLRIITLASPGLCAATYQALGQLPALNRLTIKILALHNAQGDGFPFLTARFVHLEILHVDDRAENLLPWINVCHIMRVDKLTLWNTSDRAIGLLRPMPSLQTLSTVNSPDFTGSTLRCHPNVTSLSLISCDRIGRGLKHMLAAALPQLTRLEIQASHDPFTAVPMSHQISEALGYGRCLEKVDLRGLTGLTAADLTQLKLTFSRSTPPVFVTVPCGELGQHQPVAKAVEELFLPNLVPLDGHAKHHKLELGRVGKPRHPVLRIFGTVLFCVTSVSAALW